MCVEQWGHHGLDPPSCVKTGVELEKIVIPRSSVELAALHQAAACCAQRSNPRKVAAA